MEENKELNSQRLVEKAKQHELSLAKLYGIYANKLSFHEDFWRKLSREEESHANMIEFLESKIPTGEIQIDSERFSEEVMKYLQDAADEAVEYAKEENFSHEKALREALRAEKSLVEKRYFEIFKTNNQQLKLTISKIKKETEDHIKRLKEEIEASGLKK